MRQFFRSLLAKFYRMENPLVIMPFEFFWLFRTSWGEIILRRSLSLSSVVLFFGLLSVQNAFAYSQSYLTYWETENLGNGNAWYNFVVANTGTADYSSVPTGTGQAQVHNEIPVITSYVLPILSAAAWNTVNQGTIYQPDGWSWRLVDANSQNWINSTGNSLFDNPYKVLEWYVKDTAAPSDWSYDWSYRHGLAPLFGQSDVLGWLADSPDDDPVDFFHDEETDQDGNTTWSTRGYLWHEALAPAFGFLAYSGKTLSPDQTGWELVIQDYIYTPLPPRIGDPDDPLKSSGVGAVALPTAPMSVPEPETLPMALAALGLMTLVARRHKSQRTALL